jgi:hypothetical protein
LFTNHLTISTEVSNPRQLLKTSSKYQSWQMKDSRRPSGLKTKEDSITAMVIFERGGRIKGKFAFHFVIESVPGYFGRKKNQIIENSTHRLGHSTTYGECTASTSCNIN